MTVFGFYVYQTPLNNISFGLKIFERDALISLQRVYSRSTSNVGDVI